MKKLLSGSRSYIKTMNLTDMTLLKLCLVSMGILLGLCVPSRCKKSLGLFILPLFGGAFTGVLRKFIPAVMHASDN